MSARFFVLSVLALLWVGCATSSHSEVDAVMVNQSSRDLSNAEVVFGTNRCPVGTLARTATASYLFYRAPITDHANVRWWEKEHDQRSEVLDLRGIYPKDGRGRLTFTISDSGVKVSYRKE